MVSNVELHILTIHFEPPKRGQPLYEGQGCNSQGVLYMEVPLYVAPTCTCVLKFVDLLT